MYLYLAQIQGYDSHFEGDNFEPVTDEEEEDEDVENGELETQQNLYELSEEATAFIETVFVSKLDNATRKARATKFGLPESLWLRCPKLDLVLFHQVLDAQTVQPAAFSSFGLML